jgi:hypothetical protein
MSGISKEYGSTGQGVKSMRKRMEKTVLIFGACILGFIHI